MPVAKGDPTKDFFISMLTRDIELNDAILDLLDNCLDGVMRTVGTNKTKSESVYKGYEAHIDISSKSFSIWDNCGGIPLHTAEEYAFRMGRPPGAAAAEKLPTVGIYGIGMKRAIFKIGLAASVCSKTKDKEYCVYIPETWAQNNDNWNFEIKEEKVSLEKFGTKIVVTNVHQNIKEQWKGSELEAFLRLLRSRIREHYSFIIEKGFTVYVNNAKVENEPVKLLFSDKIGMRPYLYQTSINGVEVSLAVGMSRSVPDSEEVDSILEGSADKRKSTNAGWTVICNDRVVLYNDKSHLTGWGEAGVPHYHTQFIGIKGVVQFRSNDPSLLPMTTTKRGIDLSSAIYSAVRAKMREGTKLFTSYTNQWKGKEKEEKENIASKSTAQAIDVKELLHPSTIIQTKYKNIKFSNRSGAQTSLPVLPKPKSDGPISKVIRFTKAYDEIKEVAAYLYDDPDISDFAPGNVGEECFQRVLKESRRKKK